MTTAIVAAMREELAPLVRAADLIERRRSGDCRMWRGTLGRAPVLLATTGEGAVRAEAGLRAMLDWHAVERLIVVGVSGGLSPELAQDSLLVASQVVNGTAVRPAPDAEWVERVARCGEVHRGVVLSSSRILGTAAEKSAAGGRWTVPSAADLESATFARVAGERSLPYVVLRCISDTSAEELPLDFNRYLDERGGIRRLAVARYALRHPGSIGALSDLRRRVARGSRRMACVVQAALKEIEP